MKAVKILTVIGFLVIFSLTACNIGDTKKAYYGTWLYANYGSKIIFSKNKFDFIGEDAAWGFSISPVTWILVENTYEETMEEYPVGYKITGTVSEHFGEVIWQTGDNFDEDWAYFLHKDKDKMIEQGERSTRGGNFFWFEELSKTTRNK